MTREASQPHRARPVRVRPAHHASATPAPVGGGFPTPPPAVAGGGHPSSTLTSSAVLTAGGSRTASVDIPRPPGRPPGGHPSPFRTPIPACEQHDARADRPFGEGLVVALVMATPVAVWAAWLTVAT
jgi:hypothetical protein